MYLVEFDISFIRFYRAKANRCRSNVMYVCNLYASEERIYILK